MKQFYITMLLMKWVKLTLEYVCQEQIIQIDLDRQSIQNTTLLLEKNSIDDRSNEKCEINCF